MKTIQLLAALSALMLSASCHAGLSPDGTIITVSQLPQKAQEFIQQYFPDKTASYAKKEYTQFEVKFSDGTEVEFDRKGNWDNVDCQWESVPAALVPTEIATYVSTNFPGALIVKIDKERYGYEIELSNDLELKFNKSGKLFHIDD